MLLAKPHCRLLVTCAAFLVMLPKPCAAIIHLLPGDGPRSAKICVEYYVRRLRHFYPFCKCLQPRQDEREPSAQQDEQETSALQDTEEVFNSDTKKIREREQDKQPQAGQYKKDQNEKRQFTSYTTGVYTRRGYKPDPKKHSNANTHQTNEDHYSISHYSATGQEFLITSVADGHGGDKFSRWYTATDSLEERSPFDDDPQFQRRLFDSLVDNVSVITESWIRDEFKSEIKRCEEELIQQKFGSGGTTLNSCVFHNDIVYCANLGDSRALLLKVDSKNGSLISFKWLSEVHEVSYKVETARLKKKKSVQIDPVDDNRLIVDGKSLGMTRSLGDYYRAKNLQQKLETGISITPEVRAFNLAENLTDGQEAYVLQGSDGLFRRGEEDKLMEYLGEVLKPGAAQNIQQIANKIGDNAVQMWIDEGKQIDDVTVILTHVGRQNPNPLARTTFFETRDINARQQDHRWPEKEALETIRRKMFFLKKVKSEQIGPNQLFIEKD